MQHNTELSKPAKHGALWSEKELSELKKLYPVTPIHVLTRRFGRSAFAVTLKAKELGLKKVKRTQRPPLRRWTKLEIKLLKEIYPESTLEEVASIFVGRSLAAIQYKVHALGLCRQRPWTQKEDMMLRELAAELDWEDLSDRMNRSVSALKNRASRLKIQRGKKRLWTKQEDELLCKLWPDLTLEELANRLGRSSQAVKGRANKLGLYRNNYPNWTPQEDTLLRELWAEMDWEDLAVRLNRTVSAVQRRATKLGLLIKRRWTSEEEAFLLKHGQKKKYAWIAKKLNRTVRSVEYQATKLRLVKRSPRKRVLQQITRNPK